MRACKEENKKRLTTWRLKLRRQMLCPTLRSTKRPTLRSPVRASWSSALLESSSPAEDVPDDEPGDEDDDDNDMVEPSEAVTWCDCLLRGAGAFDAPCELDLVERLSGARVRTSQAGTAEVRRQRLRGRETLRRGG